MIRDPDRLRTVWLFGKPYSWERLPGGRLTLEPAVWHKPLSAAAVEEFKARWLALHGQSGRAHEVRPLSKEMPMSGYPTPEQRKAMEGVEPGTPPSGPAGASSANPAPEEDTDA